jgi:hypothetical protein
MNGTAKPVKVTRRTRGQTAVFSVYEWLYNPCGLTAATRRQIDELTAQGEGPVRVIQWPSGEVIYRDGQWSDRPEEGEYAQENECR